MTGTPPRKPPVGSRTPTSRPRRVAGSASPVSPLDTVEAVVAAEAAEPLVEPDREADVEPELEVEPDGEAARASSTRLRRLLVGLVVVLLVAGAAEVVAIARHQSPGERPLGTSTAAQPVQLDELTVRSVVDQAAQAAVAIGSASWQDYDAGVDAGAATMTDPFAEKYRATKAEVKDQVVGKQLEVNVEVDAKGVVSATADEVVALLFLTQSTIAGTGPVTPRQYRATVTMVRTPDGWLVGNLDAGDALDITGDAG